MQPFAITETYDLLRLIEQVQVPSTFLQEVFFSEAVTTLSDVLAVEVIKQHRRLAPMLIRGSRALNMSREQSTVQLYRPPLIGARRTIGIDDISRRIAGEMPVVSTMTPQDRAAEMQGRDLRELLTMMTNRREAMAASLLVTGSIPIKGFAEDGSIAAEDTIKFDDDWQAGVETNWSDPAATIYDDLKAAVEYIAEESGVLPDVMICGRNVEGYLLKNNQFKEWAKTFRESLTMMTLEPKYTNPHARRLGVISSLGLEAYAYLGTYVDDVTGEVKPYIPADMVIVGCAGSGQYLYGRVDVMTQGQWTSYASENVPVYNFNDEAQTSSLTLYSRCLPFVPVLESVRAIKVVS